MSFVSHLVKENKATNQTELSWFPIMLSGTIFCDLQCRSVLCSQQKKKTRNQTSSLDFPMTLLFNVVQPIYSEEDIDQINFL